MAFTGRRFLRIYPALLVNLVLTAACLWLFAVVTPGRLAIPTTAELGMNLLLLDFPVNGATWTMLIEFLAVPLLLLGHLVCRRYGISGLLILLAITIAMCLNSGKIYQLMVVKPDFGPPMYYIYTFVVDYQFMFLLGMLVAELHRRDLIQLSLRTVKIGFALSLVAMFGARFLLGYNTSRSALLIEGLGCAGLVGFLVFGRRLTAHRFFQWSPIKFLGCISYSFYLYHATAIYIAVALTPTLLPTGIEPQSIAGGLILALFCVIVTVPMAWASFVLVEKPGMRMGQRL